MAWLDILFLQIANTVALQNAKCACVQQPVVSQRKLKHEYLKIFEKQFFKNVVVIKNWRQIREPQWYKHPYSVTGFQFYKYRFSHSRPH